MARDDKAFWQRHSANYTVFMQGSSAAYEDIINHIYPHLNQDTDVLELACGSGQLAIPLASRVRSWLATDFCEGMLDAAKAQGTSAQLTYELADASCLPYPDQSFDIVVIANSLHIMPCPEKVLAEIHRVLKPGGRLFAPNYIWSNHRFAHLRQHWFHLKGYNVYHRWNESDYIAFIRNHNFLVTRHMLIPCRLAPICYLEARTSFHSNVK